MSRMTYPIKTYEPGIHEILGRITFGASSAVASYIGEGITVTKNGTGLWDVVFDDSYPTYFGTEITPFMASADDKEFVEVSFTAATRTLQIRCQDISGGAAADPTSGDGISILAAFKKVQY